MNRRQREEREEAEEQEEVEDEESRRKKPKNTISFHLTSFIRVLLAVVPLNPSILPTTFFFILNGLLSDQNREQTRPLRARIFSNSFSSLRIRSAAKDANQPSFSSEIHHQNDAPRLAAGRCCWKEIWMCAQYNRSLRSKKTSASIHHHRCFVVIVALIPLPLLPFKDQPLPPDHCPEA